MLSEGIFAAARRLPVRPAAPLIAAVPYKVHIVLTDNGTHFTTPGNTSSAAPTSRPPSTPGSLSGGARLRIRLRPERHRSSADKAQASLTNGQVERTNGAIKDATVKRDFHETCDQLRTHLRDFVDAYNFARRLKALTGLTPCEFICKVWTSDPTSFKFSPLQQMTGLGSRLNHVHQMMTAASATAAAK